MSDEIPEDVRNTAHDEAMQFVEWLEPKPAEYEQAVHVLAGSFVRAILAERERCAKICEDQKAGFLSPQYASNQPFGSITERFACDECAKAIRSSHE